MGELLRVSRTCAVDVDELQWRFSRSGGPGGQHANTSDTRVEVRFDVASSASLGPRQRARLLERLGPEVRAVAADSRSQARNRELGDAYRGAIAGAGLDPATATLDDVERGLYEPDARVLDLSPPLEFDPTDLRRGRPRYRWTYHRC